MTEEQNIAMDMKFAVLELVMRNQNLGDNVPSKTALGEAKKLYKWVSQDDRKAPTETEA